MPREFLHPKNVACAWIDQPRVPRPRDIALPIPLSPVGKHEKWLELCAVIAAAAREKYSNCRKQNLVPYVLKNEKEEVTPAGPAAAAAFLSESLAVLSFRPKLLYPPCRYFLHLFGAKVFGLHRRALAARNFRSSSGALKSERRRLRNTRKCVGKGRRAHGFARDLKGIIFRARVFVGGQWSVLLRLLLLVILAGRVTVWGMFIWLLFQYSCISNLCGWKFFLLFCSYRDGNYYSDSSGEFGNWKDTFMLRINNPILILFREVAPFNPMSVKSISFLYSEYKAKLLRWEKT